MLFVFVSRFLTPIRRFVLRTVATVLFFSYLPTSAVELHLRNGDRITGTLVNRSDGQITFKSPLIGEFRVPESDAVLVEAPETPVESLTGIPPAPSTLPKPGPTADIRPKAGPPKPPPWRGKIEVGFQQQTGRTDTLQASARGEAERKSGPDDYRFEGRILYAEQYQQTTSDRYDGLFRYRHELSARVFGQAQSSYTKDREKLIDHNVEENVGMGYKVLQRPRHEGNVGAGVTLQYRSAQGVESGYTYLGEIFQDYSYKLTGRLTITQDANFSYSPEPRGRLQYTTDGYVATDDSAMNYRLRFNSALQGKVSERVSLNLRFEYEFDNAILDPKAKVDQRITTSIGYGF